MNVRKLRKLQRWILAEPRRFDMRDWSRHGEDDVIVQQQKPPCNTVGCLAGMACHMEGNLLGRDSIVSLGGNFLGPIDQTAKAVLDLTDEMASRLFYIGSVHLHFKGYPSMNCWPERFEKRYLKAKTPRGKAKVASDYIDYFIKTKGAAPKE